jgi:hypothetical protein
MNYTSKSTLQKICNAPRPGEIVDLSHCMVDRKYKKWYYAIIAKALARTTQPAYTERHHIIPVSLGGSNNKDNLVDLTGREHFICHWLLTKFCIGSAKPKMLAAMYMMQAKSKDQDRYINSRVYDHIRAEYAKSISERNTGMTLTPEQCEKVRRCKLGKKREQFSDEWKAKMSDAHSGENNAMYGKTHSDDTKEKIRQKALGRVYSKEVIARRSATAIARGYKRERKICEHCGKDIAINIYARFHGDNCKMKK